MRNHKAKVQIDEIARELSVPKYFLSKIMKKIVKYGLLDSTKGPYGGFSVNQQTLSVSLFELMTVINGDVKVDACVLRLRECNEQYPCPLHHKVQTHKREVYEMLNVTSVADLLAGDEPDLIRSISVN